jgi:hypothetical protein
MNRKTVHEDVQTAARDLSTFSGVSDDALDERARSLHVQRRE